MDLGAKKTVLRQFTYGLYAVTAHHDGERGVFTANWLTQVTSEPRDLAGGLGRPKAKAGDKFDALNLAVTETANDDLALNVTTGYATCAVQSEVEAGDSVVFIGEVVDAGVFAEGEPLTMRDAGFRHAG